MIFKERYSEIIKNEREIREALGECCIENNVIKKIDVVVTGHFGNAVSVQMLCDNICPLPLYNSTSNIGFILRALIEIFDKEDDNSVNIKALEGTPIRLLFDDTTSWGSKAVAIGHFMKDRFVMLEDLMKIQK
jgi:hypothetical protein